MREAVQQIINGLEAGGAIALFALGFTLLFGVLDIINLAHGATLTIGAFVGYYAIAHYGAPLIAALAVALVVGAVTGVVLNVVAFRPLRRRSRTELSALIVGLALLLLINSVLQIVSKTRVYTFPPETFGGAPVRLGWGLTVGRLQLYILVIALLLGGGMFVFLRNTQRGRAIRVVAWRTDVARSLGIPVERIISYTFAIASALAAVAGVLFGLAYNYVFYDMGTPYLLTGIAAVILGGLGNVLGAVIGGLVIGVVGSLTAQYLNSDMVDIVTFSIIGILLVLRPQGLLGRAAVRDI
jgi:branched-chain amino acid transport system permease protein